MGGETISNYERIEFEVLTMKEDKEGLRWVGYQRKRLLRNSLV